MLKYAENNLKVKAKNREGSNLRIKCIESKDKNKDKFIVKQGRGD